MNLTKLNEKKKCIEQQESQVCKHAHGPFTTVKNKQQFQFKFKAAFTTELDIFF